MIFVIFSFFSVLFFVLSFVKLGDDWGRARWIVRIFSQNSILECHSIISSEFWPPVCLYYISKVWYTVYESSITKSRSSKFSPRINRVLLIPRNSSKRTMYASRGWNKRISIERKGGGGVGGLNEHAAIYEYRSRSRGSVRSCEPPFSQGPKTALNELPGSSVPQFAPTGICSVRNREGGLHDLRDWRRDVTVLFYFVSYGVHTRIDRCEWRGVYVKQGVVCVWYTIVEISWSQETSGALFLYTG